MKYFRVKFGYGKDEFISIGEDEYRKAVVAQGTGGVVAFERGTISGNNIMAIVPDFQRVMGWKRDYELTGEDYDETGERIQEEYRLFMSNEKNKISGGVPLKEISMEVKALADKMNNSTRGR